MNGSFKIRVKHWLALVKEGMDLTYDQESILGCDNYHSVININALAYFRIKQTMYILIKVSGP